MNARTERRITVTVMAFMSKKPADPGPKPRLVKTMPATSTNTDARRKAVSYRIVEMYVYVYVSRGRGAARHTHQVAHKERTQGDENGKMHSYPYTATHRESCSSRPRTR